jgi:hypothetical protein
MYLQIEVAFEALANALRQAAAAIGRWWYELLIILYRKHVGRLPGSERTARLRKKRRKKLLDWASSYFEAPPFEA